LAMYTIFRGGAAPRIREVPLTARTGVMVFVEGYSGRSAAAAFGPESVQGGARSTLYAYPERTVSPPTALNPGRRSLPGLNTATNTQRLPAAHEAGCAPPDAPTKLVGPGSLRGTYEAAARLGRLGSERTEDDRTVCCCGPCAQQLVKLRASASIGRRVCDCPPGRYLVMDVYYNKLRR